MTAEPAGPAPITSPCCAAPADEFAVPIPYTDDTADAALCTRCGNVWSLDPGAQRGCADCGGSGRPGAQLPSLRDPDTRCHCVNVPGGS
ncbi:hypothetical protein [Streptomyces sp. NRRL F-2664]|uniref:hypothetical protein n=1 Tax=Streptomyces sp. NRRL F-2664 TaxID=1463842 RepID=UPI0005BD2398|nr:hypothetical protein [Streptomyces sp. NRRL F-2664]